MKGIEMAEPWLPQVLQGSAVTLGARRDVGAASCLLRSADAVPVAPGRSSGAQY